GFAARPGGPPAREPALLSGVVDLMLAPGPALLSLMGAGTFRAGAPWGNRRWPKLPDVPTIAETVAPGYEVMAWMSMATPRGVPRPIVQRLNDELRRAIASPQADKRLRDLGAFPVLSTPEEATERTKVEIARWNRDIEAAGSEPQR